MIATATATATETSTRPAPRLHVTLAPSERPVELVELHVSAEVSGALAVTTWELVFENPNARVLEGQLEFPLLDGQSVIRFAMDVNGALREAVPVPKAKGRQVFEAIVRRQVDPGLLEQTAGNSYRARIYPLLPGQRKRVVLAYQESIGLRDGAAVYPLSLDFGAVARFTLRLAARGPAAAPVVARDTLGLSLGPWRERQVIEVERRDFTARGLLELTLPSGDRPAVTTERRADRTYFRAEQALTLRTRPRPGPRVLGLLWDSSGSGAGRDVARELAAIDRYLQALSGPLEVRLVRLRDTPEPAESFQVYGGEWSALRRALETTCWDGATALDGWQPDPEVDAWLLCSDGLINFGADDVQPDTGPAPIHALLSAARADAPRLRALCERSGGEFIHLLELSADAAARRLQVETERLLALETSPQEVAHVFPEAPTPLHGQRLVLAGVLHGERNTVLARVGFADEPEFAQTIAVTLRADEHPGELAARAWAALKLAALEPLYEHNRADIERTGQDFGIVTRETSLIVLDEVEDYARHDITPPPELRPAWDRLRAAGLRARQEQQDRGLTRLVGLFRGYVDWWEREFAAPPGKPSLPAKGRAIDMDGMAMERGDSAVLRSRTDLAPPSAGAAAPGRVAASTIPADMLPAAETLAMPGPPAMRPAPRPTEPTPAPPMPAAPMSAPMPEPHADEYARESSSRGGREDGAPPHGGDAQVSIQLQAWTPDAGYLDRLRRTPDERLYHVYLEERPDHARSTAFFLDVADHFFARERPALALRVLSNLAEMELDNPAVLRILGYRLLQADRAALARPVFARVLKLRPEEPQSLRDLAQACAALGDFQAAVDLLWDVAVGTWNARFPEVELIALIELNALVAASPRPLDLARIDPRLRRALPLDLRVVLTWDADNTDIDLWVTDPAGEKAYYGNRLTQQGGRMSPDFREGYGPEEFSLRRARPGVYTVEANFYGNRQQIIAGATTIQLQLVTDFATARPQEQRVTLRLGAEREVVTVGRFTVEPRAR